MHRTKQDGSDKKEKDNKEEMDIRKKRKREPAEKDTAPKYSKADREQCCGPS